MSLPILFLPFQNHPLPSFLPTFLLLPFLLLMVLLLRLLLLLLRLVVLLFLLWLLLLPLFLLLLLLLSLLLRETRPLQPCLPTLALYFPFPCLIFLIWTNSTLNSIPSLLLNVSSVAIS